MQEKLIERYWKNIRADEIFRLLLEIDPELVERVLFVPKLAAFFESLGVKRNVGVTHAAKHVKNTYRAIGFSKESIRAVYHKGPSKDEALLRMAIGHCGTYSISSHEALMELRDKMCARYGPSLDEADDDKGDAVYYETKSMSYRSPVMSELVNSESTFSKEYLGAGWEAYKNLKKKHEGSSQDLNKLLGL